jgi:tellurite resistance protein TehA-like permease
MLIYVYAVLFMYFFVYIMIEAPTRPKIWNLVLQAGTMIYNSINLLEEYK